MEYVYHTLLPYWAQDRLREAAAVPNTDKDPRAKDKAIEAAQHEIMLRCPSCFRSQK